MTAVMTPTGLGLFVLVVGGTLPAMIRRIRVEERALEAAMGERYRGFAAARSRLVRGLW